jgi:DNA replication protein DnaC
LVGHSHDRSGRESDRSRLSRLGRLEDWGKMLGDSAAVTAMLDRLLHHGHVLKCGPRSWHTQTDLPSQEAAG